MYLKDNVLLSPNNNVTSYTCKIAKNIKGLELFMINEACKQFNKELSQSCWTAYADISDDEYYLIKVVKKESLSMQIKEDK